MAIFMRHEVDVQPKVGGGFFDVFIEVDVPDPGAVDVRHVFTNDALTLNFGLAGDVNGDGRLGLQIFLLVPPAQDDFFS